MTDHCTHGHPLFHLETSALGVVLGGFLFVLVCLFVVFFIWESGLSQEKEALCC